MKKTKSYILEADIYEVAKALGLKEKPKMMDVSEDTLFIEYFGSD